MDRRTFLTIALAAPALTQAQRQTPTTAPRKVPALVPTPAKPPAWTQWGGPHRNFQTEATGLKETWPASGPNVIWKRSIGEGYSSPSVENDVLYTMYGADKETARQIVAAVAVIVPVYINTLRGLRQVRPVHRDLMRVYAASARQQQLAVTLPTAAPFTLTGLRTKMPSRTYHA